MRIRSVITPLWDEIGIVCPSAITKVPVEKVGLMGRQSASGFDHAGFLFDSLITYRYLEYFAVVGQM